MKKKLIIIGKGTAGSQAAAHFFKWLPSNFEIEWHFDPSIPTQTVGEGATPILATNLYRNLDFKHSDLKLIDGTIKTGIFKSGWGKQGKDFFHNFYGSEISYHFNAVKLQEFIFEKLKNKIKIVEKNSKHSELDSDFIFDCSGKPFEFEEFIETDFIPVNSVHVTQCFWDQPSFNYTLTIARPYGWVFGIPLQNRCSIGYMYNNKINTLDEIKEDVVEIFKKYNLSPSNTTNTFSFNNYYRKNNFSNRIAYSGNSSFFLEPLEATSIYTMDMIQRMFYEIINQELNHYDANFSYTKKIEEIEAMISLHYFAGSKYNSTFWNYAKEKAEARINVELEKQNNFLQMLKDPKLHKDKLYSTWWSPSFVENVNGLGLSEWCSKLNDPSVVQSG